MKRLTIDLGDRSYDIRVGRHLLQQTGAWVTELTNPSRVVIITHPSINRLYGEKLSSSFSGTGVPIDFIEVPEGEKSKSLQQAEKIFDSLLEWKCDRQTVLVALGGGVIGDLTGFIAATYVRGVPFVQIPTTVLSQVDSSVGGKTAVNHPRGKNMIGAFYQPRLVVADLETLETLPEKEFKAGLAEIIKYGVIEDAALFHYLETETQKILSHDNDALAHIVATSCAIKARVVEKDERESHYRMVLNFGHTVGHAIESLTGYSSFIHGEAVAIGMVVAAKLSQIMGYCSEDVPRRISNLLEKFGLPTQLPNLKVEDIIQSIYLDKKTAHKKIRFILVKDIGSVEIVDSVPESPIKEALGG
ncbi:MAG: 3-dehydroquinate synthase [Nitrospinae bacterium]|jgi:3-dehydroquinate synthase|nr:3-dehydroquinate synthase [Nitrospinota bacterium]MDA1109899.1 3-dehydroquinate synthase [Nitrospinota bacterium]